MAIFIRFNKIDYKSPNKLILGRGLPFQSSDLTFAREHAVLVKNSKGIFLNKKSKKFKLIINGEEVKDCKPYRLTPGMSFYLGESYFEIPETDPKEFENIERIYFGSSKFFSIENMVNFPLIIAFIIWSYIQFQAPLKPLSSYLTNFGLFLVFCLIVKVLIKFTTILFNQNEFVGKELTVTQDGMTIFFENGSNFSFKFADIKSWSYKGMVTTINCYEKIIIVKSSSKKLFFKPTKNDEGELPYYLMRYNPKKEEKSNLEIRYFLQILTIYPIYYYLSPLDFSDTIETKFVLLSLIVPFVFLGALLYLLREDEFRQIWYLYDKNKKGFRKQQNYLLTLVACAYMFCLKDAYYNFDNVHDFNTVSSCAHGNKVNCDKMNYKLIKEQQFYLHHKNIQTYAQVDCEKGKMDACRILRSQIKRNKPQEKRGVASE